MVKISSREPQTVQLASDRMMEAVLVDRWHRGLPALMGEEGQSSADTLARTLIGLALRADRQEVESSRGRWHRGARETRLRRDANFVLRATVEGGPSAMLDFRTDAGGGTHVLVGGRDEKGLVGVTYRRWIDLPFDWLIGTRSSYKVAHGFEDPRSFLSTNELFRSGWSSVGERLGALASAFESPEAVVHVEVMDPDPRSVGLSLPFFAKDSLQRHLPASTPAVAGV